MLENGKARLTTKAEKFLGLGGLIYPISSRYWSLETYWPLCLLLISSLSSFCLRTSILLVMDRDSWALPTPSLSGQAPGKASGTGDLFITKDMCDPLMGESGTEDLFITDSGNEDLFIIFDGCKSFHSSLSIDADVMVERHMRETKTKIIS